VLAEGRGLGIAKLKFIWFSSTPLTFLCDKSGLIGILFIRPDLRYLGHAGTRTKNDELDYSCRNSKAPIRKEIEICSRAMPPRL
jgi:hypothetical protein